MIKGMLSSWECLDIPCLPLNTPPPSPLNISTKDQPANSRKERKWKWYLLYLLKVLGYQFFSKEHRFWESDLSWSQTHLLSTLWPWASYLTFLSLNLHLYSIGILFGLNSLCKYIYNKYTPKVSFLLSPVSRASTPNKYRPSEKVSSCPDLGCKLGHREGWTGEVYVHSMRHTAPSYHLKELMGSEKYSSIVWGQLW